MTDELPTKYDPQQCETNWYSRWEEAGYFRARPNPDRKPYCIAIPPPNVTGELHMGHAVQHAIHDNVTRRKRMQGYETLCLPGTEGTDRLIDRRRLALLPPTATLCNVGRGNALDEEALVAALRGNRLAGASLDVFREEPLPLPSPLRTCPNLWLMPHASAIAPDYLDLFVAELGERWQAREFRLAQERM